MSDIPDIDAPQERLVVKTIKIIGIKKKVEAELNTYAGKSFSIAAER